MVRPGVRTVNGEKFRDRCRNRAAVRVVGVSAGIVPATDTRRTP
jgi:hypothetical protein